MRITLDWITVKLNSDFNIDDWRELAATRVISVETGEQTGINCPDRYWKFNRYGGEDYVSAFGLGTNALCQAAYINELRVSRLDVAIDTVSGNNPDKSLNELERVLDEYYQTKGLSITKGQFDGRARGDKGSRTISYGKRSSAYQIRAYTRHSPSNAQEWVCRCEFQLRGEYARSFWQALAENYSDPLTLRNTAASLERSIFGSALLKIGDLESDMLLELPDIAPQHNREKWVRTDVLKACIRHFQETGVNLAQLLVEDFNKAIFSQALSDKPSNLTHSELEDQSKARSLSPMSYTGPLRAEVAQKLWFDD